MLFVRREHSQKKEPGFRRAALKAQHFSRILAEETEELVGKLFPV